MSKPLNIKRHTLSANSKTVPDAWYSYSLKAYKKDQKLDTVPPEIADLIHQRCAWAYIALKRHFSDPETLSYAQLKTAGNEEIVQNTDLGDPSPPEIRTAVLKGFQKTVKSLGTPSKHDDMLFCIDDSFQTAALPPHCQKTAVPEIMEEATVKIKRSNPRKQKKKGSRKYRSYVRKPIEITEKPQAESSCTNLKEQWIKAAINLYEEKANHAPSENTRKNIRSTVGMAFDRAQLNPDMPLKALSTQIFNTLNFDATSRQYRDLVMEAMERLPE